jgi:hypothetical protein
MTIELAPVEVVNPFARAKGEREENWYSPKLHTLWIGARGNSAFNVAAHELSHILLHAFTPYGQFIQELGMMQDNQVLNYCGIAARHGKIPFPIYGFAQEFKASPNRFRGIRNDFGWLIENYVIPWSHTWYLEQILEGENLPSVRVAREEAAIKALTVVENYSAGVLSEDDLFGHAITPEPLFEQVLPFASTVYESAACYSFGWNGEWLPLGAKHIFENHANRFGQVFGGNDPDEENLVSASYGHFYLWCWALLVQEFEKSVGTIDSKEQMNRVLNTFWALCDLALFTPIGVVYGRLRPKNLNWYDIHPGWRFMNTFAQLSAVGWLNDLSDFVEFQTAICRRLRWPSPDKFIELGMQLTNSNFLMHRDACLMRKQHPCPYLHLDTKRDAMERFIADHMPIYQRAEPDRLTIASSNARESIRVILNFFLPQYCWQVMTRDRLNLEEVLPKNLKVDTVFSNVSDKEALLDFIFGRVAAIAPRNFVPFRQFYAE